MFCELKTESGTPAEVAVVGIDAHIPTLEQIIRLQHEMCAGLQDGSMVAPEIRTEHYFSGGMYCRKLWRQKGTLIVGKEHKADHIFLCAEGEIIAWSEKGMRTLRAGDVIESKAGTKRVTMAMTDAIGITIHKTDKTDLDEIEAELIEPDESALFDSENKIKSLSIAGEK